MAAGSEAAKQSKKERAKARREANREQIREQKRAYYLANKDRLNAKSRAAYAANREDRKRQNKECYEKNKPRYLEKQKERYEENKDEILAKNRERYAKNKDRYQAQQKVYRKDNREKVRALRKERDAVNRDKILEQKRRHHERHRDEDSERAKSYHERNRDRMNAKMHEYYRDNREKMRAASKKWLKNNRDKVRVQKKKYYAENKDKINKANGEAHRRRRMRCIEYYSGGANSCECCGESHLEFLAVDHIGGGGREHKRRERITGMYEYLIRHGFPDGYRILCHNCNMALGHSGMCPHKGATDEHLSYSMKSDRKRRRTILEHYSEGKPKCACCGEAENRFLSLDHINNDGHVFRGADPLAKNPYKWAKRHGFPPIFQVLCHNCNACKKDYDSCPHTLLELAAP